MPLGATLFGSATHLPLLFLLSNVLMIAHTFGLLDPG